MDDVRDELEQSQDTKRKGRGRPKGAKNKPKDHIISIPPACPACESTELVIRGTRPRPPMYNAHFHHGGKVFATVEWARTVCKRCDQVIIQRILKDEIIP